jgi:uncharacterized protein DUF3105
MAGKRKRHPRRAAPARTTPPDRQTEGLTRQERKEEARRQREAVRRRMARRRYLRAAAVGTVIVTVVAGGTLYFVNQAATNRREGQQQAQLLGKAAAAAKAAGCSEVKVIPAFVGPDQGHIGADVPSPPPLTDYPSQPPASGPHNITPLDSGVYTSPPDVYQALHSLEHGAAIIWYSPEASGAGLARLQNLFRSTDHVIVAPYDYNHPGGKLPSRTQMAMVAWHHLVDCDRVSATAAVGFVHSYRYDQSDPSAYKGDAPEAGAAI